MDLSDLEFFVAVARAYPRLSATVATLAALVLVGANVRPSEAWALAHPHAFMLIRVCRAIAANAVKAVGILAEWRRDGSASAVRAFFDRGRPTDPSGPPSPAPAPVAPDAEAIPASDPTPPPTRAPGPAPAPGCGPPAAGLPASRASGPGPGGPAALQRSPGRRRGTPRPA